MYLIHTCWTKPSMNTTTLETRLVVVVVVIFALKPFPISALNTAYSACVLLVQPIGNSTYSEVKSLHIPIYT